MGSKVKVWKWRSLSHVRLFATPRNSPWNSPGQNTGVSGLSLLQGIFPTQGSNPGLPHCRQILYQLSHKGSMGSKAACQRIDLSYFILVWLYDEGWRVLKKKKKHSRDRVNQQVKLQEHYSKYVQDPNTSISPLIQNTIISSLNYGQQPPNCSKSTPFTVQSLCRANLLKH